MNLKIKKINTKQIKKLEINLRPTTFKDFIWQNHIKNILKNAIKTAIKTQQNLWHILLCWPSGYWKTTLAQIISNELKKDIKIVTWYAISKPAEIISILNNLNEGDILFIDEIHRLKPNIEEILYIAMEDFYIDMVMPEWGNIRIPINKFTLIWATTKPESLSTPLKNRFIYIFHFKNYNIKERKEILLRYLNKYNIKILDTNLLNELVNYITDTPRQIHNFCVVLKDYLIASWFKKDSLFLDKDIWLEIKNKLNINIFWLDEIHKTYIQILKNFDWWPVWLKTIALNLWLNEKAVEQDIEPLLLKLWIIEKTSRWRILLKDI